MLDRFLLLLLLTLVLQCDSVGQHLPLWKNSKSLEIKTEMKFFIQWQLQLSTFWDQTLSFKMTTLTPIERSLSETTSTTIWDWRRLNDLLAALTLTLLSTWCDQLVCSVYVSDQHNHVG